MIRGQDKITRVHRERLAYVYVRQSSPRQVRENLESQERQYELRDTLRAMGWHPENIVVVDEDQGRTADGTRDRTGFAKLRAEVCEGRAGLIMSLETARLARNNREWYHLLDVCAVYGTLVGEPGGIYDPREYDDRLYLGLKGLLSESELHILRSRLVAGARHKAQKGELLTKLPVGLVADEDGKVVLDPDRNVKHTIGALFEKFCELGTARKVLRWMMDNGVRMPRRAGSGLFSEVVWRSPTYAGVRNLFHNPRYAGAYVYGRTETRVSVKGTELRRSNHRLPLEQWKVVIQGAHPGYITWEEFLQNRDRLRENSVVKGKGKGAPGRGPGLLQGLIRCGRCSRRMQVRYRTRPLVKAPETFTESFYACTSARAKQLAPSCQIVSMRWVNPLVEEAFLEVLKPAPLEATLESLKRMDEGAQAAERHWDLKLQRAEYEVERAKRQYDRVEPEDRLVAGELERRWEERLRGLKQVEQECARWKQQKKREWNEGQLEELRGLVKDVEFLWKAPSTTNEDRKELLRLLIEDVWVQTNRDKREVEVRILWKGETQTIHRGVWWLGKPGNPPEVIKRIAELAAEGILDKDIARDLNAAGYRRRDGALFSGRDVSQIRGRRAIPKTTPPREPHVYNIKEAAQRLGLSISGLHLWIRKGLIQAKPRDGYGERKVILTEEDIARWSGGWNRQKEWGVSQVAAYLGLPISRVYTLIAGGKLPARRIEVGCTRRVLVSIDDAKKYKGFTVNTSQEV